MQQSNTHTGTAQPIRFTPARAHRSEANTNEQLRDQDRRSAQERERRIERANDFAAGEKYAWRRAFPAGLVVGAFSGFISGLVMSVLVVPLLQWVLS